MASRTDTERYDQALAYLAAMDQPLATSVHLIGSARKKALGKAISLAWGGFGKTGTPTQHMALRALLLCQQVFLRPPTSTSDYALNGEATKTAFKIKSEQQIRDAISSYTRVPGVTAEVFAQTAEEIRSAVGDFNPLTRTRSDTGFGGVTNCYGAVKIWLFKSGLCSLQWYVNKGSLITAYTVNDIIGDGAVVAEADIADIPRGWIFNIHDAVDPNVCHWGVFLGNGMAAASNTTAGAPGPKPKEPIFVDFRDGGNSAYGKFTMASAVAVAKGNYPSKRVVVKALDPTRGLDYY